MPEDLVRALGHLTLGTRLKRIGERLQGDVTRLSERHGLNVQAGHYPVLAALDRDGPASIGALARAVGVRQPAVTRTVLQLTALGLVASEPDPADQRVRTVRLTDAGRDLVARAERILWPAIDAAVRQACDALEGPLLTQLGQLEDALGEQPLDARAEAMIARETP